MIAGMAWHEPLGGLQLLHEVRPDPTSQSLLKMPLGMRIILTNLTVQPRYRRETLENIPETKMDSKFRTFRVCKFEVCAVYSDRI